ncbi:MAG: TIGR00730 family Rossman fold protein [Ktedonobacteraceae bacterium]|nr:TIGR00730 family Rossman fold protein [Ktedonobacteraceae bacterium]
MRICVFAGSKSGWHRDYERMARALGRELVERGMGLVYGGARRGVMGALADEVIALGGEVIGVIPRGLWPSEEDHPQVTRHEVRDLQERKAVMMELADAFVVLPGGLGTIDEVFEVLVSRQLGLHPKPVGLLNALGYFDPLKLLIEHAIDQGFVSLNASFHLEVEDAEALFLEAAEVDVLLDRLMCVMCQRKGSVVWSAR